MHATPPTARLPLHIPHKHGMALRHLLKYDHAQRLESANEHSSVMLAVCVSMLATMVVTVVCIFVVWRCLKRLQRASDEGQPGEKCERLQTKRADVASVGVYDEAAVVTAG